MLVSLCKLYKVSSDYLLGLTDVDPLLIKADQQRLTPENQKMLRFFEEFMLFRQKTT